MDGQMQTEPPKSKIFFSSDHHFYHINVLKFCPNRQYETIEEMNEDYVRLWNITVCPEDTVFYLGDFSMAIRPVELFTNRLNGKKILISGNHDWCHSSHKKSNTKEKQAAMIDLYKIYGWHDICEDMYLDTEEGELFALCHLPYKNEDDAHTEGKRYSNMYIEDTGTILLCGHIHQSWKTKTTNNGTLMINVGVDVFNGKPVSLEQIREIVKNNTNSGLVDNNL